MSNLSRRAARVAFFMVLFAPSSARAQRSAADASADAASGPISVAVHSDGGALSPAAMREAIARALGAPALEPQEARGAQRAVTVTWRLSRGELAVSYEDRVRGLVSRVVSAPKDPDETIRVAAMLASALAQNEAAELLGPAPAAPSTPPQAAPPTPTPPPAPAEPPRDESIAEASFIYPLATNMGHPDRATHFAFNLLYGLLGKLHGGELGLFNVVQREVKGVQLGAVNVGGNTEGLQLGTVNVARDLTGMQLGVVNVGRKVKGFQLGVVNIADDIDGVAFGVVNVTKDGGVHPLVWASTQQYGNVGVKFASRYVFSTIHASYHDEGGREMMGPGFALGARVPLGRARFEFDVGTTWLIHRPVREGVLANRLRGSFAFRIFDRLTPFAGVGAVWAVRYSDAGHEGAISPEFFAGLEF